MVFNCKRRILVICIHVYKYKHSGFWWLNFILAGTHAVIVYNMLCKNEITVAFCRHNSMKCQCCIADLAYPPHSRYGRWVRKQTLIMPSPLTRLKLSCQMCRTRERVTIPMTGGMGTSSWSSPVPSGMDWLIHSLLKDKPMSFFISEDTVIAVAMAALVIHQLEAAYSWQLSKTEVRLRAIVSNFFHSLWNWTVKNLIKVRINQSNPCQRN